MRVVILTPIALEFKAVSSRVTATTTVQQGGNVYLEGKFKGRHHDYEVIVCETGSKNSTLALAAEKAIQLYHPNLIILTGIAGGVKDTKIGDIVVATRAYGYEAGKESADGFATRPETYQYSKELIAAAKIISREKDWRQGASDQALDAEVLFGPIASGDKVIASTTSATYHILKYHFNDTVAIEMESFGFAQAIAPYRDIHGINIRGISDLLDHKAASDGNNQVMAAEHAAAFVYELLYQLDGSTFIQNKMDTKTLIKEIFDLLFSADAMKEIGSDFKSAANGSIRELWLKIKPLFIEEITELQKDPKDVMAQTDLVAKLKATVEENDALKIEWSKLLEASKKEAAAAAVHISHSKNVVQGSTINVTGDFRLGDG